MRVPIQICCGLFLALTFGPALCAQERTSWELTPYHIEICVLVEPTARLTPQLETQLAAQLTASAQAAQDGLWQVSSNQNQAAARSRLLRELPLADPPAPVTTEKEIDKVIFVAIREQAGQFQITAREWDALTRLWNIPVKRETVQTGRIAAESLAALQEAFGPLVRIERVDKFTVTSRLRGGALPRRDGSFLAPDRRLVYRPVIVPTSKDGSPQPEASSVIPWTYLVPQNAPGASADRAVLKLELHRTLNRDVIPAFHPLQLRLAVGLAPSAEPIRVRVVDAESPAAPFEGIGIQSRDLFTPLAGKSTTHGSTGRDGQLVISGSGPIWAAIVSGGETVDARPLIPGLQNEWVIAIPNDRKRLQLAAALDELHDDCLDLEIRTAVLGVRLQQAVQTRDLAGGARLMQEIRTVASNPRLPARLAEIEKQVAATDEATRNRLQPSLTKAQDFLTKVKAALEKANSLPGN